MAFPSPSGQQIQPIPETTLYSPFHLAAEFLSILDTLHFKSGVSSREAAEELWDMKCLKRLGFTPHICNPPSWCITSLASGTAHAEPWHLPHEATDGKSLRTSLSNFSIYPTVL